MRSNVSALQTFQFRLRHKRNVLCQSPATVRLGPVQAGWVTRPPQEGLWDRAKGLRSLQGIKKSLEIFATSARRSSACWSTIVAGVYFLFLLIWPKVAVYDHVGLASKLFLVPLIWLLASLASAG